MKKSFLFLTLCSALFATELQPLPYALVVQEIGKGKPVMVEAGSTSCSACKEMARILYHEMQLNPEHKIYFVDVGEERGAARAMKIQLIPTQIFYDAKGKELERHIGPLVPSELERLLHKYKI